MNATTACARLSPVEKETLILLSGGMGWKEAAKHTGRSPHTIKGAAKMIRAKLGVPTMIQAAVIATKAELL